MMKYVLFLFIGLFMTTACQQETRSTMKKPKITVLSLQITNLPDSIDRNKSYSLTGTFNHWHPVSNRVHINEEGIHTSLHISHFDKSVSKWWFSQPRANTAFRIVDTESGLTVLSSDYPDHQGNFRVTLRKGKTNRIVINAGKKEKVNQEYHLSLNKKIQRKPEEINPRLFTYPGGKDKALIMSFDDGPAQDKRLIEIFDKYGIVGTFHLNSGKIGKNYHMTFSEARKIYQNHEVSAHSVSHPRLTQLPRTQAALEMSRDVEALKQVQSSRIWGMSYPFGSYNKQIIQMLEEQGFLYARTIALVPDFGLPGNLMKWGTTCHHTQAHYNGKKYIEKSEPRISLFFVWGHAWELDKNTSDNSWESMESFCKLMSQQADIWKVSAREYALYLNRIKKVTVTQGYITNPKNNGTVWIRKDDKSVELKPGHSIKL